MKNLINNIILLTQLSLIIFSCTKYEPGIVTLVNSSDKTYYFNITVSDSIGDETTEIDFNKSNPHFPEIEPNEEIKIDLRSKIENNKNIYLFLYKTKTVKSNDEKKIVLYIEKIESAGKKFLDSSFWHWTIYD